MLKNVKYLITTHDTNLLPKDDIKEFVIVGKSNVGKSTFINFLTNNRKMAKISSKPGKTKAISLFDVDSNFRLVDIPGYGYANVSKSQLEIFGKTIDYYFKNRTNIFKVIVLLDMRREVSQNDKDIIKFLISNGISFVMVGTKKDKCNQSQVSKFDKNVKNNFGTTAIHYSSLEKEKYSKSILAIFEY